MKKWFVIAVIVSLSASAAMAAKGDATKEKYMENQKRNAETKGIPFNAKKAEKMFEQLDANGDGIASGAEKKAYWGKGKKTAAPAAKKPAATAKSDKKLAKGDSDLEHFLSVRKAQDEKKGRKFNQSGAEKMFAEIDTNKDGIASAAEKKAYWAKK